jgi:hypothetical protein
MLYRGLGAKLVQVNFFHKITFLHNHTVISKIHILCKNNDYILTISETVAKKQTSPSQNNNLHWGKRSPTEVGPVLH